MSEGVKIAFGALLGVVNLLLGLIYAGLRSDLGKMASSLEKLTDELKAERLANATLREKVEHLNAEVHRQAGHIETILRENREVLVDAGQRNHDTVRELLSTTSAAQLETIRLSHILNPGT